MRVAQSGYPDKPIRILVGFSAGVAPDVTSRLFGDKWNQTWAKGVAVENVTGAGGNFAVAQVAKAAPDGYTLAMGGNASLVINPNLMDRLGYDPVKDFAYITQVFIVPNLVVVPPDVPAKDIKELIALAKAKPDYFVAGHAGIGTSQHLGGELFMAMAGVKFQQVPYRGTTQILPDLLGGRLNLFFGNISNVLPLVREGKLRAFAITSKKRSPQIPELPTMEELGFPGYEATAWFGLMGPAGTAAADRRQDSRRDREAAGAAGRARQARKPRPSTCRQHAGGIPRHRQDGNADVGQGHQGRRHQGRRNSARNGWEE